MLPVSDASADRERARDWRRPPYRQVRARILHKVLRTRPAPPVVVAWQHHRCRRRLHPALSHQPLKRRQRPMRRKHQFPWGQRSRRRRLTVQIPSVHARSPSRRAAQSHRLTPRNFVLPFATATAAVSPSRLSHPTRKGQGMPGVPSSGPMPHRRRATRRDPPGPPSPAPGGTGLVPGSV